jgi:hypothetical protein
MEPRKTYKLAAAFAEDHWQRELGTTDTVLGVSGRRVIVELDTEGYSDMLSDAQYYWECRDQFDSNYKYLTDSAGRVYRALTKAGPPIDETTLGETP